MRKYGTLMLLAAAGLAACTQDPTGAPSGQRPQFSEISAAAEGNVYTESNAASGNAVLIFARDAGGALSMTGMVATNGNGTGAGLGSQGAVTLSGDGNWLFAVNAGSNTVSVFARATDGSLTLTDTEPTRGRIPISVTSTGTPSGQLVAVVNQGTDGGNVAGFQLTAQGDLIPSGSPQSLGPGMAGPAQVSFVRDRIVAVTEKAANRIVTYRVDNTGALAPGVLNASDGTTPFGFMVDHRGHMVVSNAVGGAPGAGSLTSYSIDKNGIASVVSSQVANFQAAPCWVVITRDRRFAYTTNTGSNTTTGYALGPNTELTLLNANGVTANDSGTPIDAALSVAGGEFLYVLNSSAHAIDAFTVEANGSLTPLTGVTGLPAAAVGLAAW